MLLNEKGEEINSEEIPISPTIKKGLVFSRRVVRDKPVYEYSIYLDVDPTNETILKELSYAKDQIENIIILKAVEDKVAYLKAKELEDG